MKKKVTEYEALRIRFDKEEERDAKILEMEAEGWTCVQKDRVVDEETGENMYVMMVILFKGD